VALASDGLESNDKGRLYLTDYEHHALLRRNGEGISANTNAPHFPPSTAPAPPARGTGTPAAAAAARGGSRSLPPKYPGDDRAQHAPRKGWPARPIHPASNGQRLEEAASVAAPPVPADAPVDGTAGRVARLILPFRHCPAASSGLARSPAAARALSTKAWP